MTTHSTRSFSHRGYIILLALIFAGIFMAVSTALVNYVLAYGRSERAIIASTQALAIAEGALHQSVYELNTNPSYAGSTNVPLGNGTYTITVTSIDTNTKRITATGYIPNSTSPVSTKTIRADVAIGNDIISFRYGIQAGAGGFTLDNSSSITGNVFSNGSVIGDGGNMILGDVISAGPNGLVYGITATNSIYAHTIGHASRATTAEKDAYYENKVNTTVVGKSYDKSLDQTSVPLPISDEQIATWQSYAAAGTPITTCDGNGNHEITTSISLGPTKIPCNLVVKGSSVVLTITGHVWVTGNITTQTGPMIRIDPSLGSQNVAIIADNPTNTTGSGKISINQSTRFAGSGTTGSFVFLISQNNSAETGGSVVAIDMSQGASALVAYASHGLLTLSQSVGVRAATGYRIALSQSANVVYDTGLPSTVFQSGSGGSYSLIPGSYAITR